jgi:hypothetical protein
MKQAATHRSSSLLEAEQDTSTNAVIHIWKCMAVWQHFHPNKAALLHLIIQLLNETTDPSILDVLDILEFTMEMTELVCQVLP